MVQVYVQDTCTKYDQDAKNASLTRENGEFTFVPGEEGREINVDSSVCLLYTSVKDTSTSHERCSIIEVMGRNAGYIALWCGIANGAEDILIPEKYDYDEQKIINHIISNRKKGKKHHIIINADGIGHSTSMARRIEAATGVETRATILGRCV